MYLRMDVWGLPKRVASDSLLASSKLCFLPLAETLDCLDCLDCRQLADVRLLPLSLCLVASLQHGVHDCAVRHALVPKTSWCAKAFRPWQQCQNGQWIHISEKRPSSYVHCPSCSDVWLAKEATSGYWHHNSNAICQTCSSINLLPSFCFTAWISLADVLLIAASKSWFEAQHSDLPTGQMLPKRLHDTKRNRTALEISQVPNYV